MILNLWSGFSWKEDGVKSQLPVQKIDIVSLSGWMCWRMVKTRGRFTLLKRLWEFWRLPDRVMKAAKQGCLSGDSGVHWVIIIKNICAEDLDTHHCWREINGCILHYVWNDKQNLKWRLLLMTLVARVEGYILLMWLGPSRLVGNSLKGRRADLWTGLSSQGSWIAWSKPGAVLGISMLPGRKNHSMMASRLPGIIKLREITPIFAWHKPIT